MKTQLKWFPLAMGLCLISVSPILANTIAFWSFNDGFDGGDAPVQIAHTATLGSGFLYQQRAEMDHNGKSGVASDSPVAEAGKSMAWDDVGKKGENDAEFFITFSTAGVRDIWLSFDIRGNSDDGIASFDLKYDTHPLVDVTDPPDVTGTIKDFFNGESTAIFNNQAVAAPSDSFLRVSYDLSTITGMNNQTTVALRLDDWKENDAMSIDNVLVTGTAIPEPATAGLALILLVAGIPALRRTRYAVVQ